MVVVFPSAMVVSSQEFCVSNREKKFSNLQSVDFVVRKRAPPTSNNIIESSILNTTFVLSVRVNYSRGFFFDISNISIGNNLTNTTVYYR